MGDPRLDWRPPSATPRAMAMWNQNPFSRFRDLINLTDEKADEYTRLLFESFSVNELRAAVARMVDIRPIVRDKAMLDEFVIGKLAKSVIRSQWTKIDWRLRRPGYILELVRKSDILKFSVLATPEGQTWLNWTCYTLHSLLLYEVFAGKIPSGVTQMPPPPGKNPLTPLNVPQLEAGRQGFTGVRT